MSISLATVSRVSPRSLRVLRILVPISRSIGPVLSFGIFLLFQPQHMFQSLKIANLLIDLIWRSKHNRLKNDFMFAVIGFHANAHHAASLRKFIPLLLLGWVCWQFQAPI